MGTEDELCIAAIPCSLLSRLPLDIHLKVVSFLRVRDVCALGRCSRYWRELCGSDSVWSTLFRKRWPSVFKLPISDRIYLSSWLAKCWDPTPAEDWKRSYLRRHLHMFSVAEKSLDVMAGYRFGLIDVVRFSFHRSADLVMNMRGMLYAIKYLKVPRKVVAKGLRIRDIHKKEVRPSKRWLYRALVRMEDRGYYLTLEEIMLGKQRNGKMGAQI